MSNGLSAFHLRPVLAGDVGAVVAHVREVLAEFGIAFGVGASSDADLLRLPHSYAEVDGAFWIAEHVATSRLVGTAGVLRVEPGVFELRKMYLTPETRGTGLGSALLGRAVAHARARGGAWLVLDTVDQMVEAIAFYERKGFVRDDRQIRAVRCTRGYVLELTRSPSPTASEPPVAAR